MKDTMASLLHKRLKERMEEAGISAHGLEKQAGLKRSAVQNILHGRSRKPSAEILQAITQVLGCSIDELMGASPKSSSGAESVVDSRENALINMHLFKEAAILASQLFEQKNLTPTKQQALSYINEIYEYSLKSEKKEIDRNFSEWLIESFLLKAT